MGTFLLPRIPPQTGYDSVRTFTRQTDSLGNLNFRYIASQFGGTERITARRVSDTTTFDSVRVSTRVPGLQALSTNHPNLITYTSNSAYHTLASSNYGLANTNSAIYTAVDQYAPQHGMASNLYLAAVDMSLPFGGGFDIAGGWAQNVVPGNSGHILHREGKSVDFSKYYKDAVGNNIQVNIYRDGVFVRTTNRVDQRLLDRLFREQDYKREEKKIDKIHYESLQ